MAPVLSRLIKIAHEGEAHFNSAIEGLVPDLRTEWKPFFDSGTLDWELSPSFEQTSESRYCCSSCIKSKHKVVA
jgi:hypothetical protein